jgi:hypothetical protein
MALQPRPDGRLIYVAGVSRMGKTVWTAHQVAPERRVLVWDAKDEWSHRYHCRRVESWSELAACVKPGAPIERIAFCPPIMDRKAFDRFCKLAWVWLRVARGALVIEELADVTTTQKAPPAWGEIIRKGLGYGPTIYALTQRPAEADKTSLGNASIVHTHKMVTGDDQEYIARKGGFPLERVQVLQPLEFLERDAFGVVRSGRVQPGKRRAVIYNPETK